MEPDVQDKFRRIVEAHNRINQVAFQIDERINQLAKDGSVSTPPPPIDIPLDDIRPALDQLEVVTQQLEQRLQQSLQRLNAIPIR